MLLILAMPLLGAIALLDAMPLANALSFLDKMLLADAKLFANVTLLADDTTLFTDSQLLAANGKHGVEVSGVSLNDTVAFLPSSFSRPSIHPPLPV